MFYSAQVYSFLEETHPESPKLPTISEVSHEEVPDLTPDPVPETADDGASLPVILSWSGGKDSSLALDALLTAGSDVRALLTTVTEVYGRVSMHGIREELLDLQAQSLGLPLVKVSIPPHCPDHVYQDRMGRAVRRLLEAGPATFAFGDLFLEDVRAYREDSLLRAGASAVFPIWGSDTADLARRFIQAGFKATVVTVDPRRLDPSFAGRVFDSAFLEELPPDVDPMGERGEFHTFVHDGPIFHAPLSVRPGKVVEREGYVFQDMVPLP